MQGILSKAFSIEQRAFLSQNPRCSFSQKSLLHRYTLCDKRPKTQWQNFSHLLCRNFTSIKSSATTSTLNPFDNVRAEYILSGKWSEKENLKSYIQDRIINLNHYFSILQRSPEEDQLAEKIMARYLSKKAYNYIDSLPYRLNLQKSEKTLENFGPHFFREREIDFYLKYGFIGPKAVKSISQEKLKEIHARFTGMLKGLTPDQNRKKILRQEWRDKDILDLVTNEEIVAKVSSLLGENIKMRFTSMHEVPPGEGSFSNMTSGHIPDFYAHSDMNLGTAVIPRVDTEKPFCDRDAVSVWISISGTNEDNAPLFVFPGTHLWDITTPLTYLEHTKHDKKSLERTCRLLSTKGFANQLNANHYLYYDYLQNSHYQKMLTTTKKTEMYMAPGDCLFFTTHLLHGSGINQLPVSRLGMSVRYSRALNPENEENLSVVRALFSKSQQVRLGLSENDDRIPIIQVLGTQHHERSKPINLKQLREILAEKASDVDMK